MKKPLLLILMFLFTFGLTVKGQDEGKRIPFQGSFYEDGEPFNGNKTFTFMIDLGDTTWTETQENVQIVEGLYAVILGATNSLPEDLFFDADSRSLTVAVGGTTLGTVDLYAPFALNDGQNFGEGVFRLDARSATDSTALVGEIYGSGNGVQATAIKGIAQTDTTANVAIWGDAKGSESNRSTQLGVYGTSNRSGDGFSVGVWGVGSSTTGGTIYGLRGEARGTESGFSAAARGLNFSTTPETGGSRYGGYFNTYSSDTTLIGTSYGVRGAATGSQSNYGALFDAFGENAFFNYGVYARASGATENYSGWFEGGKFILNDVSELNFWGPNSYITLRVEGDDWNTDTRGYGKMDLRGPSGQNIYLGAKAWEEGGADKATLQMWGQPLSIPGDTTGNTYQQIFMEVASQDNGDGEQGYIILRKEGQGDAFLNYDILKGMIDNQNQSDFANLSVRSQNPITDEFGNTYNPQVFSIYPTVNYEEDGSETQSSILGFTEYKNGQFNFASLDFNTVSNLQNLSNGQFQNSVSVLSQNPITDEFGNSYNPELVRIDSYSYQEEDGSETQVGNLSFTKYKNGEFNYTSLDFDAVSNLQGLGQGTLLLGNPTTDEFGNSYNPPLINVYNNVFDDETGSEIQSGNMSFNNGNIQFDGHYGNGSFSGNVTATSVNQTSDRRLKKNITRLTSGLATVQQLRGVRYNWKDESKKEDKIGFIAQEVEEVLPELVSTKKDGFKAVNYAEMTAVLVEAVKELSAQIEMLQQENADLKAEVNKVNEMEERLAMIESLLNTATKSTNSDQK